MNRHPIHTAGPEGAAAGSAPYTDDRSASNFSVSPFVQRFIRNPARAKKIRETERGTCEFPSTPGNPRSDLSRPDLDEFGDLARDTGPATRDLKIFLWATVHV